MSSCCWQIEEPTVENIPMAHCSQVVARAVAENVPLSHFVHFVAPDAENVPGSQLMHFKPWDASSYVPAVQLEHDFEPGVEVVPDKHALQLVVPVELE